LENRPPPKDTKSHEENAYHFKTFVTFVVHAFLTVVRLSIVELSHHPEFRPEPSQFRLPNRAVPKPVPACAKEIKFAYLRARNEAIVKKLSGSHDN
jgi:hypothetical protein